MKGGAYVQLNSTPVVGTSYVDVGAGAGNAYFYAYSGRSERTRKPLLERDLGDTPATSRRLTVSQDKRQTKAIRPGAPACQFGPAARQNS